MPSIHWGRGTMVLCQMQVGRFHLYYKLATKDKEKLGKEFHLNICILCGSLAQYAQCVNAFACSIC